APLRPPLLGLSTHLSLPVLAHTDGATSTRHHATKGTGIALHRAACFIASPPLLEPAAGCRRRSSSRPWRSQLSGGGGVGCVDGTMLLAIARMSIPQTGGGTATAPCEHSR